MKKRIFSLGLASVMALSMSVPAFASDLPTDTTIEATANILDAELKVASFAVPTAEAFTIYLDPHGLADIANGGSVLTQELGVGGRILGSAPVPMINHSSYPVKVAMKIGAKTTGSVDFKENDAAVTAGTDSDEFAFLYAMPSLTAMKTSDNFVEAALAIPLPGGTDTEEFSFGLPAAQYKVTNSGGTYNVAELAGTALGNGLYIGGSINKKYDAWTESNISIEIKFDVTEVEDATALATLVGSGNTTGITAFGMSGGTLTGTAILPNDFPATKKGPSVAAADAFKTMATTGAGADVTIPVSLGMTASATVTAHSYLGSDAPIAKTIDMDASTIGMVTGRDYVEMSLTAAAAASVVSLSTTTLTVKKSLLGEAVLNKGTEVIVTFRFKDASGVAIPGRAPIARILKSV